MAGLAGFRAYLAQAWGRVFGPGGWPEWLGGILLGIVNIVFLALAHKPFSIYTGFLQWGRAAYQSLGLDLGDPQHPLVNVTSAGDIGLFLGAFLAAVAANELRLRRPAGAVDVAEAVAGGVLMAAGVVLALGCNWGGFFSAITALSLHGYLMFLGLLAGGYLGALYVEWRARREAERIGLELELEAAPLADGGGLEPRGPPRPLLAVLGLAVGALLVWAAYRLGGPVPAAAIILGGAVGVVLQRARFCFATAFRDILRGGGEFSRSVRLQIGIALGIAVGATGAAVLKYMGYVPPEAYVKPAGLSNIVGGVLFGFGMAIAGGCASGSLWRAAEGHVKLWVALAAAVLAYAPLKALAARAPWLYGDPVPLTALGGWAGALALVYATMAAWVLAVLYLDYRRRWAGRG